MTDTTEWHPLVAEAYADHHYLVDPIGEMGVPDASLASYRYNSGVLSLCFKYWDAGLPPFVSDAVLTLRELGVPTSVGSEWTTKHLDRVIHRHYLHDSLVAYRTNDNIAYVSRMADRGRRSVYQHDVPNR